MRGETALLVLSTLEIKCPFCEFKARLKVTMRHHLKRNHTEKEGEDYIKKHIPIENGKTKSNG